MREGGDDSGNGPTSGELWGKLLFGICAQYPFSDPTELTIPPSANVFYAMDGVSHDFVLRQRRRASAATPGSTSGHSASGTPPSEGGSGSFPRIKATGRKIARALF